MPGGLKRKKRIFGSQKKRLIDPIFISILEIAHPKLAGSLLRVKQIFIPRFYPVANMVTPKLNTGRGYVRGPPVCRMLPAFHAAPGSKEAEQKFSHFPPPVPANWLPE